MGVKVKILFLFTLSLPENRGLHDHHVGTVHPGQMSLPVLRPPSHDWGTIRPNISATAATTSNAHPGEDPQSGSPPTRTGPCWPEGAPAESLCPGQKLEMQLKSWQHQFVPLPLRGILLSAGVQCLFCLFTDSGETLHVRVSCRGAGPEGWPPAAIQCHHLLVPPPQPALEEECGGGAHHHLQARPQRQRGQIHTRYGQTSAVRVSLSERFNHWYTLEHERWRHFTHKVIEKNLIKNVVFEIMNLKFTHTLFLSGMHVWWTCLWDTNRVKVFWNMTS